MDLDRIKSDMQKLGEEVFGRHGEEVFQALRAICLCGNLVQDWETWKQTDNIWMPRTDEKLRVESIQELNRVLEEQKKWKDERIPLRNFLISGIRLMTDMYDWEKEKEEWLAWMSGQILVNQYSGIRLFQEYIYLLGLVDIREGSSSRELLEMFRFAVPVGGQETYDWDCEEIEHKLRKERNTYMRETVERRFDRWIKIVKGTESADIIALFNERYQTMSENEFCKWVENYLAEATDLEKFRQAGYEVDEMEPEERKDFLSERKDSALFNLAELFVYAKRDVRLQLLKQLSDEEQEILLESWMKYFYPAFQLDLTARMDRITAHVGEVWD